MAILRITDDTTTINFYGDDNYKLIYESWSPQRAQRRASNLGGLTPYTDPVETIPILIRGDSAVQVYEKLEVLSDLLDQAERWAQGDVVSAVKLVFQPDGSTLTNPLEAVILGPGGNKMLSIPDKFAEVGRNGYVLSPIIIRVLRSGLWLGDSEAKSSSASTSNPEIVTTASFTDTPNILSPMDIQFLVNGATGSSGYEIIILLQNEADKLYFTEAEDLSLTAVGGTSTFASAVVATASGGDVARFTFSAGTDYGFATDTSVATDANIGTLGLYVIADNNTGSDLTLQARTTPLTSSRALVYGPTVLVPSSASYPDIYFLGLIANQPDISRLDVYIRAADTTEAVTGTCDLDYICGIGIDQNAHVIAMHDAKTANAAEDLFIEHRINSRINPLVYSELNATSTLNDYISYSGNVRVFMEGSAVSGLIFGVDQSSKYYIGASATPVTLTATRSLGYLIPQ